MDFLASTPMIHARSTRLVDLLLAKFDGWRSEQNAVHAALNTLMNSGHVSAVTVRTPRFSGQNSRTGLISFEVICQCLGHEQEGHAVRFIRDEEVVWILIDEDARKKKELPASFVKLSDEALWMMVREVEVMAPFKNELHPRRAERLPMTLFHLASDLRFEEPAWKETLIASVRAMAQQKQCVCTVTVNGGRVATIHDGRENYFMLTPVSSTRDEYPDVRIAQRTAVNGRDVAYGEVVLCGHMVNTLLSPVTLPALDA